MGVVESVVSILTGGVAGGVTGILGSIASGFMSYKLKRLEYEHEEKMFQLQMQAKQVEIEVAKAKIEGKLDLAEQETLRESYKELLKSYFTPFYYESLPSWMKPVIAFMFALLDFIRGLVRPTLTYLLLAVAFWIAYRTYQANPEAFTANAQTLVTAIVYLTVTAIAWWYSARPVEKFLMQKFQPTNRK